MTPHPNILFLDIEYDPEATRIRELGAVWQGEGLRTPKLGAFADFARPARVVGGHNIIAHDLPVLRRYPGTEALAQLPTIDTLYLSVLFFPKKKYHRLVKDDVLDSSERSNPLADAQQSRVVFEDAWEVWEGLPKDNRCIYYQLLKAVPGFDGFFGLLTAAEQEELAIAQPLASYITQCFSNSICETADLEDFIQQQPIALAFALALIAVEDSVSLLPPWVSKNFPETYSILNILRLYCAADRRCTYCQRLQPLNGLRRFFGFEQFRRFDGDGEVPLQQQVVEAAMAEDSLLAIFPTGGGKSLTFQLPALMKGEANRSLTVIISPLQSLMKDQVDVLRNRHERIDAVTINGLLSPLERSEALERVRLGGANLLYLSPESLRSRSIYRLLVGRSINRFVIDEAHCFSSWGQDFRVDYLYIGKFIKKLQKAKGLSKPIPVSCFTATAKPAVVDDIYQYFNTQLGLKLQLFKTSAKRKNLHYFVHNVGDQEEKYERLKSLIFSEDGAKIIYVSRVKAARDLAERLGREGVLARPYYGKMNPEEKKKTQDAFMDEDNELDLIIATSAFGMGVDKDNVKMVIHYNISDSLENYMQESGRAGRRADLEAKCHILFDENDLSAHFDLLNHSKLSQKEVDQIWRGIKGFRRRHFTKSALEIAKKAGWDTENTQSGSSLLETRVKVALSALEESGYIRRDENAAQVFAQSILVKNVEEAQQKMKESPRHFIGQQQQENAKRIFSSLMSRAKARQETQVDYVAEALGIHRNEVTTIINIFKDIGIMDKEKDLRVYYFTVKGKRNSSNVFRQVSTIERLLLDNLFPQEHIHKKNSYLREVNEAINEALLEEDFECNLGIIRDLLNYWAQVGFVKKERIDRSNNQYLIIRKMEYGQFREHIEKRLATAELAMPVIKQQYLPHAIEDENFTDKKLIEFSVSDLKQQIEKQSGAQEVIRFYELLLLYFHHLKILELKDGLLIFYNPMKITRLEDNNRKQYTQEDYQQLARYYQSKTEQIHIVGEYARKQLLNKILAVQFADDYFVLPYEEFLSKYFSRKRKKIKKPITEERLQKIFGELSEEQKAVIDDKSENILVAAGPGSGKTKVLVHKVASLLLVEDVKTEQFLMLTFSKPAAIEFKNRLRKLVGPAAYHVDIFTYHGFAFQLMGRIGDLDRSQHIISDARRAIEQEEAPMERIKNKSVIVVDEYQDVSRDEYDFIMAIVTKSAKIRVIVAGDDDQNIYEFRGTSIEFMRRFIDERQANYHILTTNYRSKYNLVAFTNLFLQTAFSAQRMKHNYELQAHQQTRGSIEITRYRTAHLIVPLIYQLHRQYKSLEGSTAVLTHRNDEAVLITSILKQLGLPAQLIQDKQGFSLRDLFELRRFSFRLQSITKEEKETIEEEHWEKLKAQLPTDCAQSNNLDLVLRVVQTYEKLHPTKYLGSWRSFLKESRIQDFYNAEQSTILVSTMHKSKGKEFDNVFILLNNYQLHSEAEKRVLYVAMTRAKSHLFLHSNAVRFAQGSIRGLDYREDKNTYESPKTLILDCGMRDVWLGFVKRRQVIHNVKQLNSGCPLFPSSSNPTIFTDEGRNEVLKLSRPFEEKLNNYLRQGYEITTIQARFIVVWYDEESDRSYRVVLPEITLKIKEA
ncbi:MAG: RecQ family ATP-dependent DNA helicase [Bacteroidota bacterium]